METSMEFLGVKWSLGTASDFWAAFAITVVVLVITFGGYQLLRKIQGKNWKARPNAVVFTLLLAVSIVIGRWVDKWIFG
jgi:NADH:ubiquinone oxidoreductase subunit H